MGLWRAGVLAGSHMSDTRCPKYPVDSPAGRSRAAALLLPNPPRHERQQCRTTPRGTRQVVSHIFLCGSGVCCPGVPGMRAAGARCGGLVPHPDGCGVQGDTVIPLEKTLAILAALVSYAWRCPLV